MVTTKRKHNKARMPRSEPMTRIKAYMVDPPLNFSAYVPVHLWATGPAREGLNAVLSAAGIASGWLTDAPYYPTDVNLVDTALYNIGKEKLNPE